MYIAFDRPGVRSPPVATSTLSVAEILRKLDETCQAALALRADIERQMNSYRAGQQLAKDDIAVITARKTARKKPSPSSKAQLPEL